MVFASYDEMLIQCSVKMVWMALAAHRHWFHDASLLSVDVQSDGLDRLLNQ